MYNGRADRERRRDEATARDEERAARGDAGQLRHLEQRGFGECKEAQGLRAKLLGGTMVPITGELEVEE